MTRSSWNEALARALTEQSFRARLLADPAETLRDYGLAGPEITVVGRLQPRSLRGLATQLQRILPELRHPYDGEPA